MTSLADDGLFQFAQRVPLAGLKTARMAQRGAGHPGLTVLLDLVSRVRIVLAAPVSAQVTGGCQPTDVGT